MQIVKSEGLLSCLEILVYLFDLLIRRRPTYLKDKLNCVAITAIFHIVEDTVE